MSGCRLCAGPDRSAALLRPGHDRAVGARAPFGPGAVVEALDLAAGFLHRQRQDGGGHARSAGGDDRLLKIDLMLRERRLERVRGFEGAVLDDVDEGQVQAAGHAAAFDAWPRLRNRV